MLHLNPKAWLWLLAIITKMLDSSFLKLAQSVSYGFLLASFFISVAYAMWWVALVIVAVGLLHEII